MIHFTYEALSLTPTPQYRRWWYTYVLTHIVYLSSSFPACVCVRVFFALVFTSCGYSSSSSLMLFRLALRYISSCIFAQYTKKKIGSWVAPVPQILYMCIKYTQRYSLFVISRLLRFSDFACTCVLVWIGWYCDEKFKRKVGKSDSGCCSSMAFLTVYFNSTDVQYYNFSMRLLQFDVCIMYIHWNCALDVTQIHFEDFKCDKWQLLINSSDM